MKPIRFGMPVLIECPSLAESSALCRSLGLDFVELNMGLPMYQPGSILPEDLNRAAKEYGIFYTVHFDGFLNPCDFNPYISEAARQTVLETIALAKACGIPLLNMHLSRGDYFTLPTEKVNLYDRYLDEYLRLAVLFRDTCTDAIGNHDVKILIENCSGYTAFQKTAIELLLESPAFGLTLDTGHSFKAKHCDEKLIFSHRSRLHHIHFHDADDTAGDHLALGDGCVDKEKILTLAQENSCTVVLETKTAAGLAESVRWLQNNHLF